MFGAELRDYRVYLALIATGDYDIAAAAQEFSRKSAANTAGATCYNYILHDDLETKMAESDLADTGHVADTLRQLHGVWHDRVELFELDGKPLADDPLAGSPGQSPFENLVYIDFDGSRLQLTNVHLRGRDASAKTFRGSMQSGVLVFDELGPGAYENIGMSGGPGIITFAARSLGDATDIYMEPDFIMLIGADERIRHTVLYRDGVAIRTLTAKGKRLGGDCSERHELDPRGNDGPVHGESFSADIWAHLV